MNVHPINLINTSLTFYPRSLVSHAGVEYGLVQMPCGAKLAVLSPSQADFSGAFEGDWSDLDEKVLLVGPLSPKNAVALRSRLDWLQPRLVGRVTSAGMGDRIGLATPGHVRAVRAVGGSVPIFAQQSIREMARTNRSPQQVIDDATWGMFQEGWLEGAGADADHLKTPADIDACLAAGFTFFTIDPGAQVDARAETSSPSALRQLAELLPENVRPGASGLAGREFDVEGLKIFFDEFTLNKAAVKYGGAVAHVAAMYRHLAEAAGQHPFELEVSIDETEQPTSHAEHIYIASELTRLGVVWVSLAPRYIGRFEKGVDYIGDLKDFDADFAGHAAIARCFGGYKLSLHSGSDKFRIYPSAFRLSRSLVHLKTAGTSYLEALRTIAAVDVELFRQIYSFSLQRYDTDRASYHVSAEIAKAGAGLSKAEDGLPVDQDLALLLDDFHAREILHVAFGSVLTDRTSTGELRFYDRFITILRANQEAYSENIANHFVRHLKLLAYSE